MTLVRSIALALLLLAPTSASAATLELVQDVPNIRNGWPIVLSPDGLHVYVVDTNDGIYSFTRDPAGQLLLFDATPPGVCVEGLVGASCVRSRDCDVSPGSGRCFDLVRQSRHATMSADGACLYVLGSPGLDSIAVFGRDVASGTLTFERLHRNEHCLAGTVGAACEADAECDTSPGLGDGHCLTGLVVLRALVGAGAHFYATVAASHSLMVFERSGPGCGLDLVQRLQDGVGGIDGLFHVESVEVDADGSHVYTGAPFDNALGVYARDAVTGMLSPVQTLIGAACSAGQVGGRCRQDSDCDSVFESGDGVCAITEPALVGANDLAISPDGVHLYVGHNQGIAVFSRDDPTGMVTLADDGFADPPGSLGQVARMTFLPDGSTLFLRNGIGLQSGVTLERDAISGRLTPFLETDPLNDQVVTADGAFLYGTVLGPRAYAIHPSFACSPAPAAGCRQPVASGKAQIKISNDASDGKDKALWKWLAGAATTLADYGDPRVASNQALCLYDAAADPQPRLGLRLPAGGICEQNFCWVEKKKFRYKTKLRIPDGIEKAQLDDGADGKAKIQVQGRGARLDLPPLGFTPPVVVQLQSSTGLCFEARYSVPKKNDAARFEAKAD